ncbi:MAG: acyl carrier protein [Myxococcales bacterium]|nr:acyl carrier protein [Myxococcales bacterium]
MNLPVTSLHAAASDRRRLVIETIAEILELQPDTVRLEARLREDLGMDSLTSLELLSSLSRTLKVDLEMEEAMEISTVADTIRFVDNHLERAHG